MSSRSAARAEARLDGYSFLSRGYFYLPVLVPYLESVLARSDNSPSHTLSMSVLALFAVGISIAEYPSGVFADWAGRARALIVGSLIYAAGCIAMLFGESFWTLAAAQLLLGTGVAFLSGADAALLYAVLREQGEEARYGAAVARMRFWNLAGIACSGLIGGWLYSLNLQIVFIASAVSSVLSVVPLIGFAEPVRTQAARTYRQVLAQSVRAAREIRVVPALILLGGVGTTFFTFAYWSTQSFLSASGVSPLWMGIVVTSIPILQAATMPVSAWIAEARSRRRSALCLLLAAPPAAFLTASLAVGDGSVALGAAAFIAASTWGVTFRNLINVRLQEVAPEAVRASLLSLESWAGAVSYVLFFPLAGWLVDANGTATGWQWIAAAMLAGNLALGVWSGVRGAWTQVAEAREGRQPG